MLKIDPSLATRSYTSALAVTQPVEGGGRGPGAFERMASDFMATMREGEEAVKAGLAGRADAHSVVQAIAQTEIAVQTAVAVRDKVVEAYQEILRMPV